MDVTLKVILLQQICKKRTSWTRVFIPKSCSVWTEKAGWAWKIGVVGRLQWTPVSYTQKISHRFEKNTCSWKWMEKHILTLWTSFTSIQPLFISVSSVFTRNGEGACHSTGTVVSKWADSTVAKLLPVKTGVGGVVSRVGAVRGCTIVPIHTPVSR